MLEHQKIRRGSTEPIGHRVAILVLMLLSLQLAAPSITADGPSSRAQVETPVILWPMDNIENGTLRPEFIFKANYSGGGGLTYMFELATDMEFKNIVQTYASNLDGGFRSLDIPDDTQPFEPGGLMAFRPFFDLEAGKAYWWRSRAEAASSPGTTSQWTEPRTMRFDESIVHHKWSQKGQEQLLNSDGTHLDPMPEGTRLGKADVVVFKDTFPTTTINSTNWPSMTGPATIDAVGSRETSEPYSLRLNGQSSGGDMVESRVLDLSTFINGTVIFHFESGGSGNAPDPGEWLKMEIFNSSNGWEEVFFQDGNSTNMNDFIKAEVELPERAFHQTFKLRFVNNAFSAGDDWFVDDVEVRCRTYRSGSLVSDAIRYVDGPERKTGWSAAGLTGQGNVTITVQELVKGSWEWTGPEASVSGQLDLSVLDLGPVIRLVANFSDAATDPQLHSWSIEWERPVAPFIEVLNPQPGEVLGVREDYVLRWVAVQEEHPLAQNPISIYFSPNGSDGPFEPIVKGIANSGEYTWKVPDNASEDCWIRIEVMDDQPEPKVGVDLTEGAFSIVIDPPEVTLLAPNGQEELWAGDSYLIRWRTSTGSYDISYRSVSVLLSLNGASGDYTPLFENIEDTGNISWIVPNFDSKVCFIKVFILDDQATSMRAEDLSDQQFTIRPDDVKPYVAVTDPTDGKKGFPPEKPVSISFSEDMNKVSAEEAFEIEPKAKGDFIWYENTMVFVPGQGLQEETSYEVVIHDNAMDINGNNLRATYKTRFDTGNVKESAFQKWSFAILSIFIIGLGIGIAGGGWYLKKRADEAEAMMTPTVIDELFLMSVSGKLIKHYTRRLKPDVDQDILSGMLVAVQGFVKDTFKGEAGQLEELTFGEFKVLIARGKYTMIAAVVKGPDPKRLKGRLLRCINDMESKQRSILKDWDGDSLSVKYIDPFMRRLIAGKYKKK